MDVLITGGAGFIGSHLCEQMIQEGHSVVAVDNFNAFYPPSFKRENLHCLLEHPAFTLVEGDVLDRRVMEEIFGRFRFDVVYHLAGQGGIPQSTREPFLYLDETLRATMIMLELAAHSSVRLFVNASSSAIYGERRCAPLPERARTDSPMSIYAALKKSSELLCHAYHHLYGTGIVNVRFFSVYGPRGRRDQVVHKFAEMIDADIPIPDVQPDPRRDFTHVDDIVRGLAAMRTFEKHSYATINLGYGKPERISALIRHLERALGKKAIKGDVVAPLPSDAAMTYADRSRAKALLNWEPEISLQSGVESFVEWYRRIGTR